MSPPSGFSLKEVTFLQSNSNAPYLLGGTTAVIVALLPCDL